MKKFGARYVYLEETPGAAGGGAAAGAGTAAPGAAAGAAGAGAQEPGGAPGAGAGAGAGGAAAGGAGSALSTAGAPEWTPATVPEKYRVMGENGELDITATFRKVDEARGALEKRMGDGTVRPKTADEYKLPETDVFKSLPLDEKLTKAFKEKAHNWGLSQAQYENVMTEWATLAPSLVEAGQKETVESTVSTLKEAFGDNFQTEMRGAFKAINSVAAKAGLSYEEVDAAIGNNPTAIRLFAALSKEMGEDSTPAAAAGATGGNVQTSADYMQANWAAYSDTKHPQHKAVTDHVARLSARENKGAEPI